MRVVIVQKKLLKHIDLLKAIFERMKMGSDGYAPLFETKTAKGRLLYRLFAVSIFVGICWILVYRVTHIPREGEDGRWAWIGLFGAELWFSLYWVCTQALRWNCVYRCTFPDRLSQRFENELPRVDIFVCTSDPMIEPPMMVINTVLSVMAFDYPPEKLSVYLSDDAGSDLIFYALLEASRYTKHWIPYCKKFNVEPRSPGAYFLSISDHCDLKEASEFLAIKKLYEDMEKQIRKAAKLGRLAEEIRSNHEEFSQCDSYSSRCDHDTILQILIDRRDPDAIDVEGCSLPNLVYLAREKRPQHPHNFKAGAMNALLRVSQKISNGQIILNVDCDMYSNNSNSVRDALCFFMDEKKGNDIAFVQFPQNFENVTKNEIYSGSFRVGMEVEFHGMDGYGGPPYVGTGCFHRREILCGRKFDSGYTGEWQREESLHALEYKLKAFATCEYEENTEWGKEMGLKYGCPVEDVITGLSIQCKGWKSVYYNPERKAFLGVSTTTLPQTLVQHKRWSEGDFLILLSKYSPAWYAHGKISLGLQLGYCCYCLWAPTCLATLYYSTIPSLCILRGIFLFPQFSSPWFVPFAYVISAKYTDSLVEFLWSGGTILGWWNNQRIWLYLRTSSYLFGFIDAILKSLGFSDPAFEITSKVADEDVMERYNKEIMEFGASSPMFTLLATLALLNLFCFGGVVKKVAMEDGAIRFDRMVLQILLCGILILINWPLYQGLFFRKDKGKMPSSTTMKFGALKFCVAVLLALVLSPQGVFGIRFVIDREECFSYNVQYEGDTVHTSFVVIKSDKYWYGGTEGVDLVVKGPTGDQVHDFRGKISEKFDFVAHHKGVYRFCFTNQSPYHETVDFDVHVGHFSYFDEHAKDEHFNPLLDQISKLEEALYNIQFEQHWLEAQTERQAILNEAMGKRAVYKAFWESAALIGASVLQVYLLRRLFERKLGMSRV
ncbi:cellulose synthase-like protein E1 isoform X2 [Pistacia vera]|uniref:cellulose synthase-like protein E1 isoform X2 n=2 Tax=Pistacia vera TaxID=55513 RepID=UPI00126343DD|nr:cellulose synthase-like protein E1 isoform X2 [Pistacia vera]